MNVIDINKACKRIAAKMGPKAECWFHTNSKVWQSGIFTIQIFPIGIAYCDAIHFDGDDPADIIRRAEEFAIEYPSRKRMEAEKRLKAAQDELDAIKTIEGAAE